MAIDVFQFKTEIQNSPEANFTNAVRTVNYGEGYTQVAGDGINSEKKEWPITISGQADYVKSVLTFIRAHITVPFIWTDPIGERTTYIVDANSVKWQVIGRGKAVLSATLTQYYLGGV